jgi:hypothetical protein
MGRGNEFVGCEEVKKRGHREMGTGDELPDPPPQDPTGNGFPLPVGIILVPSPSPNRGIPSGESGIGSLLTSLLKRPALIE